MKIVYAGNNKSKLRQIRSVLSDFEVLSLEDCGIDVDVEETGKTFEQNAYLKASVISKLVDYVVVSDDSGLCIDALDGYPGVHTKRFLGDNVSNQERVNFLIEKMKDVKDEDRTCHYVCCICVMDKNQNHNFFAFENVGRVAKLSIGENTFGFFDLFELADGRTFAQMTESEQLKISARAKALESAKEYIEKLCLQNKRDIVKNLKNKFSEK